MPPDNYVPKPAPPVITKVQGYMYRGSFFQTLKDAQKVATKDRISSEITQLEKVSHELMNSAAIRNAFLCEPRDRELFIELAKMAEQYNALVKAKEALK
jgi:hypothetical protein